MAYAVAGRDAEAFMERILQEMRAGAMAILAHGEYTTGELAASIEMQGPKIYGTHVRGAVGSRLDNALVVHDGAKVHDIFPKAAPTLTGSGLVAGLSLNSSGAGTVGSPTSRTSPAPQGQLGAPIRACAARSTWRSPCKLLGVDMGSRSLPGIYDPRHDPTRKL